MQNEKLYMDFSEMEGSVAELISEKEEHGLIVLAVSDQGISFQSAVFEIPLFSSVNQALDYYRLCKPLCVVS